MRASRDVDGKNVFALAGRGTRSHLVVSQRHGRLADTDFAGRPRRRGLPVGVILQETAGFAVPIGADLRPPADQREHQPERKAGAGIEEAR